MRLPILFALLVGIGAAVVAAPVPKENQKLRPVTEEQLNQAVENLKHVNVALHAYHETHRVLPRYGGEMITNNDGEVISADEVFVK
jgi:hypothetical protein